LAVAQAGVGAITVVVNDQTLPATPAAVQVNNHVLLPMQAVFGALGAQVTWDAAKQTAIALRGADIVSVTVNNPQAQVNDQTVTMETAPTLINGLIYVPARLLADAWQATVNWDASAQTVQIKLAPLPAAAAPPAAPPPAAGTVTGVVQALGENRLVLSVDKDLKAVNVQATTTITRNNQPATLTDLRLGDQVEAQSDAQGNATSIKATYETLTGKVVSRTARQLTLDSRTGALNVDPATEVTAADGKTPAMYSDIAPGDQVTVRLTPGTNRVYGITLATTIASVPPATVTPSAPTMPGVTTVPPTVGGPGPNLVILARRGVHRPERRGPRLAAVHSGPDRARRGAVVH
jgi:hypothetical protein